MESNLTPEYITFVKEGQNINALVQSVIDRIQYLPGFLDDLHALLGKYEDPFEEVPVEVPELVLEEGEEKEIKTTATGALTERRLKPEFCK